jgi:hypothetical protein
MSETQFLVKAGSHKKICSSAGSRQKTVFLPRITIHASTNHIYRRRGSNLRTDGCELFGILPVLGPTGMRHPCRDPR